MFPTERSQGTRDGERGWLRAIAFHSHASRVNGCSRADDRRRRHIPGPDGIS